MTVSNIWTFSPLLIIACGSLIVLLSGAIFPGRKGTFLSIVVALGTGLWVLQSPPNAMPVMGIALTPFARFLISLFSFTAACTLLLSHDFNEREGLSGEEYPATVLFALFGKLTDLVLERAAKGLLGQRGIEF